MATTPRIKIKKRLPIEVLDNSRAYGEVYGEPAHQIAFTQKSRGIEEWPYDASGDLIEAALNEKQKAKLAEWRKAAAAAEAAKPADADDEIEVDNEAETIDEDGDATEKDDGGINLKLWLKGETRHKPGEIQQTLKTRYGVNKARTADQALYLVEEAKILPRAEVHKSILPKVAV